MDLLSSRYASPFFIMDGFVGSGRFLEFVLEILDIYNEEQEGKQMWELYLHRVYDKTFNEFVEEVRNNAAVNDKPSDEQIETTLTDCRDILNNFIPESKGVNDGAI